MLESLVVTEQNIPELTKRTPYSENELRIMMLEATAKNRVTRIWFERPDNNGVHT